MGLSRLRAFCAIALAAVAAARQAKYGEAQILISGGQGSTALKRSVAAYPGASPEQLVARAGQFLVITFDVTDAESGAGIAPHQAFVRLVNKQTHAATVFVAASDSASDGKKGVHKLSLDVSDRKALAGAAAGGDFDVYLTIGDASIDNPVDWRVAAVSLQPPPAPAKAAPPLYTTPLLHESDQALGPLPGIEHAFRQPETRPPAAVSLAFTGVIAALLVAWLGFVVVVLRPRWGLPGGASTLLWAALFHGFFALILLLFVGYWLAMDMFTTLTYTALLALPAFIFGRQLLVQLQDAEAGKSKAE